MLLGGVHRTVIPECIHSSAAQPAQNIPPKPMRTGNEKDAVGDDVVLPSGSSQGVGFGCTTTLIARALSSRRLFKVCIFI